MLALTVFACKPAAEHIKNELRAPAYPLVTIDRVPMSDWFYTDKPEYCMFIARSVVGGYSSRCFLRLNSVLLSAK